MEQKHTPFKDHLLYILIPLVVVTGFVSYQRFVVNYDYIVSYEGQCDPRTQNCFMGCTDDSCTDQYYYTKAQKYAADLYAQCGEDITNCESASVCLSNDQSCSILFCEADVKDGICETINEGSTFINQDFSDTDI